MIENRKNWIIAPTGNLTMVLVVMLLLFTFTGCGAPRWYESYGYKSYHDMTKPSLVPVLITALGDENPDARTGAAVILGDIGPEAKEAVPSLVRALADNDKEVRKYAAQSLGLIGHGTQEVISALIEALSDPEDYVGDRAAYALELLGPQVRPQAKEAVLALIRARLDYSNKWHHDSRHKAIKRFGLEPKELVPILVGALGEREGAVRARAANELARLGPEAREAVPALMKALGDHDADVRRQASGALGAIGPDAREAAPALIKALGDNYPRARKSAVKAIGKIGAAPELVGPALTVALSDPDPGIRNETLLALEKIGYTGHDFLQSLEKIADKDPNNTIRKLASDMLRKMRFTALASGKPVEPKQAPTAAPPVSQTQRPAPPPIGLGQRWAVVIGISQYHDTRIPSLRYASVDAESFYEWLISLNGGKYAPSRVNLLIDRDATARNIRQALFEWLGQALEEDIVTIYFAGHGSPQSPDRPSNLFFLPYDAQYDNIASTGFPMWDIETALKRFIKANKVVVIADACHAGGVGRPFDIATRAGRGIMVNPINAGLQNLSKVGDGVCVISASDEGQLSQEGKTWGGGHGVFTYFLLQGLEGEADYNNDDTVMLGELIPYLSEKVRRATRNAQSPVVAGKFDPALTIAR